MYYINRKRRSYKLIAFITASFFFLNIFTADALSLSPESRFKPFFERHGLDLQNMAALYYASGQLRELLAAGEVRESHIMRLNQSCFSGGEIEIEKEIKHGTLACTGRPYDYAVFRFKKEKKIISALFIKDHSALTEAELKELGVITDADKEHFNSSSFAALKGVWFKNGVPTGRSAHSVKEMVENQDYVELSDYLASLDTRKQQEEIWQALDEIIKLAYNQKYVPCCIDHALIENGLVAACEKKKDLIAIVAERVFIALLHNNEPRYSSEKQILADIIMRLDWLAMTTPDVPRLTQLIGQHTGSRFILQGLRSCFRIWEDESEHEILNTLPNTEIDLATDKKLKLISFDPSWYFVAENRKLIGTLYAVHLKGDHRLSMNLHMFDESSAGMKIGIEVVKMLVPHIGSGNFIEYYGVPTSDQIDFFLTCRDKKIFDAVEVGEGKPGMDQGRNWQVIQTISDADTYFERGVPIKLRGRIAISDAQARAETEIALRKESQTKAGLVERIKKSKSNPDYPDAGRRGTDFQEAKTHIVELSDASLAVKTWPERSGAAFTDEEMKRFNNNEGLTPLDQFNLKKEDIRSVRQSYYDRSSGNITILLAVEDKNGRIYYLKLISKGSDTSSVEILKPLMPTLQELADDGAAFQLSMGNQGDLAGNFTIMPDAQGWKFFGASNEPWHEANKGYKDLVEFTDNTRLLGTIRLEGDPKTNTIKKVLFIPVQASVPVELEPKSTNFILSAYPLGWGTVKPQELLRESYTGTSDLRHVFGFPYIDKKALFMAQLAGSPEKLERAFKRQAVDFKLSDEGIGASEISELLVKYGYRERASREEVQDRGDYHISGDDILLIFQPAAYPLNALAVGKNGQVAALYVKGESRELGANYWTVFEWARKEIGDRFGWEPYALFALDNGKDPSWNFIDEKGQIEVFAVGKRKTFNAALLVKPAIGGVPEDSVVRSVKETVAKMVKDREYAELAEYLALLDTEEQKREILAALGEIIKLAHDPERKPCEINHELITEGLVAACSKRKSLIAVVADRIALALYHNTDPRYSTDKQMIGEIIVKLEWFAMKTPSCPRITKLLKQHSVSNLISERLSECLSIWENKTEKDNKSTLPSPDIELGSDKGLRLRAFSRSGYYVEMKDELVGTLYAIHEQGEPTLYKELHIFEGANIRKGIGREIVKWLAAHVGSGNFIEYYGAPTEAHIKLFIRGKKSNIFDCVEVGEGEPGMKGRVNWHVIQDERDAKIYFEQGLEFKLRGRVSGSNKEIVIDTIPIAEVMAEAGKIHDKNLELTPAIPDRTIICHIIAESILPVYQKYMLRKLEQEMRDNKYSEKVAILPDGSANEKEFMDKLDKVKADVAAQYPGCKVQFDVACPWGALVKSVQDTGIKAIAFRRPPEDGDIIQLEGVILALRALAHGNADELINVYRLITGEEPKLATNDIDELARNLIFSLPVRKIDIEKITTINKLIEENIKNAA